MPRVKTVEKARTSKRTRYCARRPCQVREEGTIEPGDSFYTWAFRYGGARFQHVACGYPRRSQLTQSAMGEVYDAIETAEATIAAWDGQMPGELTDAIEEVVAAAESVIDQYTEADEAMGGHQATEAYQRAEELEGWKDELEGFSPTEWHGEEPAEGESRTEDEQQEFDDWVEEQRGEAQSVLDNCPL